MKFLKASLGCKVTHT